MASFSGGHKEAQRKYKKSAKGKIAEKRYAQSEKGKIVIARYHSKIYATDEGKAKKMELQKKYRQTEKGKAVHNDGELKLRCGITLADKRQMYVDQRGLCKLCGKELSTSLSECHTDHNHTTGKVRGLLHPGCNWVIVMLESFPELVDKGLEYIQEDQCQVSRVA